MKLTFLKLILKEKMATNDVNELTQKFGNFDIKTSSTKFVLNIPVYVKEENENKEVSFTLQDLLDFPYRTFKINKKQKKRQTLENSFLRSNGWIDEREKDIFEDDEKDFFLTMKKTTKALLQRLKKFLVY